jgi:Spy/CpxP family protein refolding chaperone
MKKLMMILFTATMTAVNAMAQEAPKTPPPHKTPEERAANITARMTKSLALNPDQQQKVKAMILQREQEKDELREKAKGSHEKMQAAIEGDLKNILTPEQFEKFKKNRDEAEKKRAERKSKPAPDGHAAPPPPPAEK